MEHLGLLLCLRYMLRDSTAWSCGFEVRMRLCISRSAATISSSSSKPGISSSSGKPAPPKRRLVNPPGWKFARGFGGRWKRVENLGTEKVTTLWEQHRDFTKFRVGNCFALVVDFDQSMGIMLPKFPVIVHQTWHSFIISSWDRTYSSKFKICNILYARLNLSILKGNVTCTGAIFSACSW